MVAVAASWALVPVEYPLLGEPGTLPPLDEACEDLRIRGTPGIGEPFESVDVRVCFHHAELGTIGFVDAVGPVAPREEFVLYERDGELRWTNCALTRPFPSPGWARAPRGEPLRVHLGYAGWRPDQLSQEIEAGAWTVVGPD